MSDIQSFIKGYELVQRGVIKKELSPREIITCYKTVQMDSFRNGITDALIGDSFRYNWALAQRKGLSS